MKIVVLENGPVLIEVDETKMALCRCGQSDDKPYCDGSHKECEFRGEAVELWPLENQILGFYNIYPLIFLLAQV